MWEPHFRPQERLEDLELERHNMEFLFGEGDTCTFMRPDTFEQVEVPNPVPGLAARFLQPGMELPVEFFDGHPIPWSSQMWPKPEWLTQHLPHSHSHRWLSLWLARFQGSTLAKRKLPREQAHPTKCGRIACC